MNDHAKTKQQLIDELQQLRQQVAELKAEEHQEAVLRSDARVQAAASADVQDSLRLKCEALFAQAIRSAQANIFCLDMGTGEFIASAATKALHRIPADAFINQEAVIATIHPEDRPRVEKAWEGCIERGDCCLTEYRVVQPDGNVRWIASQAQVFPGPHGPKFLGMCRDITERKQAEEQLRMSENRHRLLFDAMAEGFVLAEAIVDEHRLPVDFRVLEANPAAAELTGISIQAAIGKTARELIPGIGKEWIKTLGETALSGEATTFERYARSLNKWFHVLAYGLERDTFACFFVDITERKQIEDALRSTRDTLQTVLDTAPAGILVADQDGKFTLANAVALEIFGGSPTGNVYGPLGSYEVFHSDGSPVVPAELPLPRALYQGEITRQAELLIRRKDGSEVVVLAAATPLHDSEGRIRGAIAVLQDITERKHAEEALRQSEERLFFVVENSEDTIFIQDKDLRYLWVSKPTWPFTMNEILGKTDFDFEGPQEQFQRMVKIKRTVLHENSPVTTELSLSLKGRPRFFGVTYKPWCDAAGHVIGLAGYARDITVRKQADAALRQSEERLKRAEAIAHLGSWELDLAHDHLSWSDEVYRIFGMQPQEFGATYEAFLEAVHPDDRQAVDEAYSDSLRDGCDGYEIEHRVVRKKSGEIRFVHEKCEHVRDESGRIIRSFGMVHDITERKQAEEALRQSKERLRLALDAAHMGTWERDISNDSAIWNDEEFRILGYEPGEVNSCYQTWVARIHPEDLAAVETQMRRSTESCSEFTAEYRMLWPDGTVHWGETRGRFEVDEFGKAVRSYGVLIDITKHKQAEEALRESEQRFRAIYELAPLGIALVDSHTGRFLQVNPRYEQILSRSQAEILSLNFQDITHPDDLPKDLEKMQLLGQGKIRFFRREKRYLLPDGSYVWVNLTVVPMWKEGEVATCHIAMIEDITERKRAEAELRQSEWKYRTLFETIDQGVVYRNAGGEILSANFAAEQILGLSLEAMQRHLSPDSYWNAILTDGTKIVQDQLPPMIALKSGRKIEDEIIGVFNPREHGYRWLIVDSIPQIWPEEKSPSGVFTIFRDITELKEAERELRRLNETLERRVKQRTAELKRSQQQFRQLSNDLLQAQENERKRIATEIHDNAGQVLAAIKYRVESAYLKLEKTGVSEALQPVKDLIPTIQACINDMRRLQMELRPSILDDMGVATAVEWFCREFQKTYPSISLKRRLTVNESELSASLKLVIFRIIQEALNNVGKHSDASLVHIQLQQREESVMVRIKDNGRGFDVQEAQEIKAFGQGLGLSSMQERAHYSGGTLTIQSTPGQGTCIEARWTKRELR